MAQQLFQDFEGDPRVEEVRRKRMPERFDILLHLMDIR
jgi:hypothetical protein